MMEAMQRALEVPHMTFCDEVHADRLGQLRTDLKEAAEKRGVRLSYLPLIVKVGTGESLTIMFVHGAAETPGANGPRLNEPGLLYRFD